MTQAPSADSKNCHVDALGRGPLRHFYRAVPLSRCNRHNIDPLSCDGLTNELGEMGGSLSVARDFRGKNNDLWRALAKLEWHLRALARWHNSKAFEHNHPDLAAQTLRKTAQTLMRNNTKGPSLRNCGISEQDRCSSGRHFCRCGPFARFATPSGAKRATFFGREIT